MKKALWKQEVIDEYRYRITESIANEKDDKILSSYYNDLVILESIEDYQKDGKCFIQSDNFKEKSAQDIYCLTQFEDFYDDICSFDKKRKLIPGFKVGNIDTREIKSSDVMTFVFDFFHQFDDDYSKILDKIYVDNKDNLIFSNHRSVTFSLSNNQGYFINIENSKTIEEYINAVHEYAHAIADYIKLRYYSSSNYPFFETLPIFAEVNALDYLEKTIPNYKNDIYTYKRSILLTLLNMARKLIYQHDFYTRDYTNSRLIGILSTMLKNHDSFSFVCDAINSSIYEKYMYLISYLVSIELLLCDDFELAKFRLNKILETDDLDSYVLFLYDIGINLNEHTDEYIKSIRDNKKIIKF